MATLSDLTTRVLNMLGSDAHLTTTEAEGLLQTRYEELYERFPWSKRLRSFSFSTAAQVTSTTTDTVTATLGSSTITSIGTPFTAAMVDRQIQIGSEPQYFFIKAFTSSNELELGDGEGVSTPWPRDTASGLSFRIFQSLYTMPASTEALVALTHTRPITKFDGSVIDLDYHDPERTTTADEPTRWVYAGVNATNIPQIELWPVPSSSRLIRGYYRRLAPTLTSASFIDIPVAMLVYQAAADCANMLFAKTGDKAYQEYALFYERKYTESKAPERMAELDRTSHIETITQYSGRSSLAGTDFAVDHHIDL